METAEHGDVVLVLPVDVNENEEASKSYGSHADCNIIATSRPLIDNGSRVCAADEGQTGKGYVYIASNGKSPIVECVVLPSQNVRVGNTIMRDLVADCLPIQMHESGVISNLCNDPPHPNDHRFNGFTESSVQLMVGSEADGGGNGGPFSCSDTAASAYRHEEGNGMLLQLARVSQRGKLDYEGETQDSNSGTLNEGDSNMEPGPQPPSLSPLSCRPIDNHQQNYTFTDSVDLDMKMANGDMDCYLSNDDWSTDVDTDYCSQMDTCNQLLCQGLDCSVMEVNVANGGLHTVNTEATCDLDAVSSERTTNVPFDVVVVHASNLQLQNIQSSPALCERNSAVLRHSSPEGAPPAAAKHPDAASSVPDSEGVPSESSAKLPSPSPSTLSENTNSPNTEPSMREDLSECSLPARPLSLRTNPNITVSLSCDATPLSPEDGDMLFGDEGGADCSRNTYDVGRRQSAPEKLPDGSTVLSSSKKFGISDFFTRNLFSRKPKEPKPPSQNAPGWRLFGKVPLRENTTKDPKDSFTIQKEYPVKVGPAPGPQVQLSAARRKNLEFEPLSTTALILEDRPSNLPAKSVEEAMRHKQEYDEMVAGAKRRELKEAQKKKRQMKERFKQEDSIANAMVIWNNDVLPNWDCMRNTRRVRELWWQGLPPSVRGRVWSLAIGNELNITPELFEIFLSRAKERWKSFSETSSENETEDSGSLQADRESSLDLIKLDISRTFPSLFIFQKGGPYHDLLHSVLGAYTCYRPDVGYVQGMSFIAAVLILNLEEADAFIAFANLLNKPCQMAFFRVDHDLMLKYFAAFEVFFEENLPRLFNHFQINNLTPDLYLIDWIFTLYSKSLPLDVACRVWDVFCRDGEECLFRTGLGILRLYQEVLLQMDFIHMAQFLTRLPDDMAADNLFSCITATQMLSSNRKWGQVFSALMKDGSKEIANHSPAPRS
ncbi:TBC1 domain family member 12-like [Oncorhynchus clarkii lewisi]|uniref:TBC1 domain family member 12-like n=1 Tax=Oncorhynchus clarkii lewisi TaxID=490388 RepID=UPI0039B839DC